MFYPSCIVILLGLCDRHIQEQERQKAVDRKREEVEKKSLERKREEADEVQKLHVKLRQEQQRWDKECVAREKQQVSPGARRVDVVVFFFFCFASLVFSDASGQPESTRRSFMSEGFFPHTPTFNSAEVWPRPRPSLF